MKVVETVFLAEAVTTRANHLVMVTNPKSEADRKKMSPFAKIGRIGGQTIRGWVRHAMEKLLLSHGISVCHPLSTLSVTADRNKEYFARDVALGYHPRGACKEEGGCILRQMFGDLDEPGNLITQSVNFYPTTSGNGTATKNINKLFGCVGSGRVDMVLNSPRCRSQTHQVYMAIENFTGVMIEAPLKLILRTADKDQETILLKTLEFLKIQVQNNEFDFLLGGMRTAGYGKAAVLPLKPKKSKKSKNLTLIPVEDSEEGKDEEDTAKNYTIQFSLKLEDAQKIERAFHEVVQRWKVKFPIKTDAGEEPPHDA